MRFNTHHPALLRSVDPTPPGEADGGGSADPAPTGGEQPAGNAPTAEDIEKLTRALTAERARARQFEAQLREAAQVNPQLMADAQAKVEAAERQRELIEAQTKQQLQEQERKYAEQLARVTGDLQAAKTAAEREALRIKTEREFLAAKGLAEASPVDGKTHFDAIWSIYGTQFAEDARGLYLADADGSPRLDTETGKRVTPAEFFAKLRKDHVHGVHFQPEYGSGSGSRNSRDGSFPGGLDLDSLSGAQLIAEGLKAQAPRRR
jgi:hypothetical protein